LDDRPISISQSAARRSILLGDEYVMGPEDAELATFLLGGQNYSYSVAGDGSLTWGAFGKTFTTLGELRLLALEHPAPHASSIDDELPAIEESETVGIEIFGVRLRALADVVIEKGLVTGPELLGRYSDYHERSFEAFRDLMLLRPEIFEERFAGWLTTEKEYRARLAADRKSVEP
jgi:hypothetical protein